MSNKVLDSVQFIQKAIVVSKDGKILALKRAMGDDYRAGCWDLPGGRYEEGEDVMDAIKREIKEEVNLNALSIQPIYLTSGVNFANQLMSGKTVFAACHLCSQWSGEVAISEEHTEFRWVTPVEFMDFNFGDAGGFFKSSIKTYIKKFDYSNLPAQAGH